PCGRYSRTWGRGGGRRRAVHVETDTLHWIDGLGSADSVMFSQLAIIKAIASDNRKKRLAATDFVGQRIIDLPDRWLFAINNQCWLRRAAGKQASKRDRYNDQAAEVYRLYKIPLQHTETQSGRLIFNRLY